MPEGVKFVPTSLAKQSKQLKHFFFTGQDKVICPVTTLKAYKERTLSLTGAVYFHHKTSQVFVILLEG